MLSLSRIALLMQYPKTWRRVLGSAIGFIAWPCCEVIAIMFTVSHSTEWYCRAMQLQILRPSEVSSTGAIVWLWQILFYVYHHWSCIVSSIVFGLRVIWETYHVLYAQYFACKLLCRQENLVL